jgi:hypothetical protein
MTPWHTWRGTPRGVALSASVAAAVLFSVALFSASLQIPHYGRSTNDAKAVEVEHQAEAAARYLRFAEQGRRRVQMRAALRRMARPGLVVVVDSAFSRDMAPLVEQRVRAAWGAFSIDAPQIPIVLAAHAGVEETGVRGDDVPSFAALPLAPGEPCIVMLRVARSPQLLRTVTDDARMLRQVMFGCALFARYGDPGTGMRAEFARLGWTAEALQAQDDRSLGVQRSDATIHGWSSPPAYLACAAGDIARCAEGMTVPTKRLREYAPGMSRSFFRWGVGWSDGAGTWLAYLQASVSTDQFRRVWRDDRPIATAVHDATGQSIGVWAHRAILRGRRPMVAAFSSNAPLVGRAVLFVVFAAALSALVQRRRAVA